MQRPTSWAGTENEAFDKAVDVLEVNASVTVDIIYTFVVAMRFADAARPLCLRYEGRDETVDVIEVYLFVAIRVAASAKEWNRDLRDPANDVCIELVRPG
jgi:hypothetical protein